jgi:hypothetical protein
MLMVEAGAYVSSVIVTFAVVIVAPFHAALDKGVDFKI